MQLRFRLLYWMQVCGAMRLKRKLLCPLLIIYIACNARLQIDLSNYIDSSLLPVHDNCQWFMKC
jgi:hypothetical protein